MFSLAFQLLIGKFEDMDNIERIVQLSLIFIDICLLLALFSNIK